MDSSLARDIQKYFDIVHNTEGQHDREIQRKLRAGGITAEHAYELTLWIPTATARFYLSQSKVTFSEYFQFVDDQTQATVRKKLADVPIYSLTLRLLQEGGISGLSRSDLMGVASRSAEFRAINQALNAGEELSDLEMQDLTVYGFDGSTSDEEEKPRKKWYQFW